MPGVVLYSKRLNDRIEPTPATLPVFSRKTQGDFWSSPQFSESTQAGAFRDKKPLALPDPHIEKLY